MANQKIKSSSLILRQQAATGVALVNFLVPVGEWQLRTEPLTRCTCLRFVRVSSYETYRGQRVATPPSPRHSGHYIGIRKSLHHLSTSAREE